MVEQIKIVLKGILNNSQTCLKALDFVRWQGVNRFESRVYTVVREHLKTVYNAASGQKMGL